MTAGPPDPQAALMQEGDRLAQQLAQTLHIQNGDQERLLLLGRSLAVNLIQSLIPTIEQITRHAGKPLHALLTTDERGRALVQTVTPDGELRARLPAEDLLEDLLYTRGRLHPVVQVHLQDALTGSEHHATRALADALRSKVVLEALRRTLTRLMR
ncbi:MAG: hypothetical protein JWQ08_1372 [Deinococcus sp.]|nr:hypothetical protein [Deinococcus sp.]